MSTRIFEILRQRGLLSVSSQKVVTSFMETWHVSAFKALTETHIIEEGKIADILATELKLPRLSRIRLIGATAESMALVPYEMALDRIVFPFEITEFGNVHAVVADPTDSDGYPFVQSYIGKKMEIFIGERSEILGAIQKHYPLAMQLPTLKSLVMNQR